MTDIFVFSDSLAYLTAATHGLAEETVTLKESLSHLDKVCVCIIVML